MPSIVLSSFHRASIRFEKLASEETKHLQDLNTRGQINPLLSNDVVSAEISDQLLRQAGKLNFQLQDLGSKRQELEANELQIKQAITLAEKIEDKIDRALVATTSEERIGLNAQAKELWKQFGNILTKGSNGVDPFFTKLANGLPPTVFTGTAATDYIYGTPTDDQITSLDGWDRVYAGDGNDEIITGDGRDYVYAGNGNDHITTEGDLDRAIYGELGDDTLLLGDSNDAGWGGYGNDHIEGGNGNDTLFGEYGDDYIDGGDGIDNLRGGFTILNGQTQEYYNTIEDWGDNILLSGAGADRIYGGGGNDTMYGGDDDDLIYGYNGDDIGYGGNGDDRVYGMYGNDILHGGEGNDIITGDHWNSANNVGNDVINGGEGNDHIVGYYGNDILFTGNGTGTRDSAFGGEGNDIIVVGDGHVKGTNWGNRFQTAHIRGENGNDVLFSGNGQAYLGGDNGDDVIIGLGTGVNFLAGGNGNDLIFVENTLYDVVLNNSINAGNGDDILVTSNTDENHYLRGWNGIDIAYDRDNVRTRFSGDGDTDYMVFESNFADYTSFINGGWDWIEHNGTGLRNWTVNVEYLQFQDGYVSPSGGGFVAGIAPGFTGSLTEPVNTYTAPDEADYFVDPASFARTTPTYKTTPTFAAVAEKSSSTATFGWNGPTTDWEYAPEVEADADVIDDIIMTLSAYLGEVGNNITFNEAQTNQMNNKLLLLNDESANLLKIDTEEVATKLNMAQLRQTLAVTSLGITSQSTANVLNLLG